MASSSFRETINSLGWSHHGNKPINTSRQTGLLSSIKSFNPFKDTGYVQLPTTEGQEAILPARNRREEEDAWLACESIFPFFFIRILCYFVEYSALLWIVANR